MYFITQLTTNDCLFTAFKILLANVRKDENYLYLKEEEKRGPYSYLEIIEKGKEFGIELIGFEADDKMELPLCTSFPLILNVKRPNQGLHCVYVYKVTKTHVFYLDSDVGKLKSTLEKFVEIWDGKGLMIKTIMPEPNEVQVPRIKVKKNPLSKVFLALSALSFIFGVYFMDEVSSVLIPISLIVGGLLFEVISKAFQVKDMKKFDRETERFISEIKPRHYAEFLPRREALKMSIFGSNSNFLFYFLSCAFVIVVVLMNNPLHIACVFLPILLAIIQSLFLRPLEKKKNIEVECLEVKFGRERNDIYAIKTLRDIEAKSYKFALTQVLKKAIGIMLFFIAAVGTLIALKGFELINIFFLVFTEIFLYQNLLPIFSYEARKVDEKLNYMRFINLIQ